VVRVTTTYKSRVLTSRGTANVIELSTTHKWSRAIPAGSTILRQSDRWGSEKNDPFWVFQFLGSKINFLNRGIWCIYCLTSLNDMEVLMLFVKDKFQSAFHEKNGIRYARHIRNVGCRSVPSLSSFQSSFWIDLNHHDLKVNCNRADFRL
jgi:hypothetical protein